MLFRKRKNPLEELPLDRSLTYSTIILLSMAVLPHVQNIRIEIIGIYSFLALWRIASLHVSSGLINRWIIYLFAAIGFSITAWYYGPPVGRTPGIAFLIVMLGLKLLEIRNRRDLRIALIIGYFTVITHFLFHSGLSMALPMLILVFGFTWLMVQMGHVSSKSRVLSDLKLVGKMFVQALPFAIILFFLFPRLAGSLWLFQWGGNEGVSGLSDTLSMGSISELIESEEPAFTVTFLNDNIPVKANRYWRGTVLWNTDGRQWKSGLPIRGQTPRLNVSGPQFSYRVDLDNRTQNWLYALDMPTSLPENSVINLDYTLGHVDKSKALREYELTSSSQYAATSMTSEMRERGLALPADVETPRLRQLVNQLSAGADSDAAFAQNVLQYFYENNFVYTLRPPLLSSSQPVDEFLFESRQGFCGHYASSFVTLMRLANIPARVVIGYLGGEYNPRANQINVTQAEAHAWAEVWLESRGWVRIDPTAYIAPERVENSIDYNSSANDGIVRFSPEITGTIAKFLRDSKWMMDAIQLQWREWFLGFDAKKQKQLLQNLKLDHLALSSIGAIAFLFALGILYLTAFSFFRMDKRKPDLVQKSYLEFCRKMERRGVKRLEYEGPQDYLLRLCRHFPESRSKLQSIIGMYIALRYGNSDRMDAKEFDRVVRRFKPHRPETSAA